MEETQSPPRWAWRHFVPVVAPLAIGLLFFLLGESLRAVILCVIAGITLVMVLFGVPVDRYLARFGGWIASVVGLIASLVIGVLLVLAGWLSRIFRRDPLTPRRLKGNQWQPAASQADSDFLATATYGLERANSSRTLASQPGGMRGFGRAAVMAVGAVTLLLLADLGVGLAWDQISGPGSPAAQIVDRVNFTGNTNTVADIRASSPAMQNYPWADEYFRETQITPSTYWPFTESRPMSFDGKYVNIEGWSRASYESKDLPEDALVVWMFGGSTTWGEGQRDDFTIASYLARIAEDAGRPIRVVNYGQRGWTHFQEMILFEQLLASEPAPEVAIFYDGANEINAQTLGAKGVPSHTLADQYAEKISGGISPEFAPDEAPPAPPSKAQLAWESYLSHSAVQQLVRAVKGFFDPAAGASELSVAQGDSGDSRQNGTSSQSEAGFGDTYVKTQQDAARALDVYSRGRALTTFLAEEHGVIPVFFWQPVSAGEAEKWANANISAPTINISDALNSREDVYIDGGHTNEEGARIVAERIWDSLAPVLKTQRADLPRGAKPATPKVPVVPPAQAVPTSEEMFEAARSSLDAAEATPCSLGSWSSQLAVLRASDPAAVAKVVALSQRFLLLLAAQMQPEQSALKGSLTTASERLDQQAAAAKVDPSLPLLEQLPLANDAEFRTVLESALVALGSSPRCI
ncbi:MAG: hypothetical protein NTX58_14515 [Actinobacteria bacterium]|nr:hypothetical protein [Actinomycetota bacterium]